MKPVTTTPAAIHLALLVNMLSMGSMMMVMPLGPDLVTSLGMAPEQTGYFSGGATQGAALIELIAAPWLDRVNRKPALLMLLTLRFLLLMACALVQNSQLLLGQCGRAACSYPGGTPCPYPGPVVRLAEPLPAVWALRPAAGADHPARFSPAGRHARLLLVSGQSGVLHGFDQLAWINIGCGLLACGGV
ncbi:hypothetical protein Q7I16_17415 [Aeromonas veronii]|nr:MFS transporter [Aeromonas veronii]